MKRTLSKEMIKQITDWAQKELKTNYANFPKNETKEAILQIIKFFKFLYKKGAVQIELSESSIFVCIMLKLRTSPSEIDLFYRCVATGSFTYLFYLPDFIPSFFA